MSRLILFVLLVCSICDISTCTSETLVLTFRAVVAVLDVPHVPDDVLAHILGDI